ncbi:MAG: hypothetical protein P8177_09505, partial [Gemmatimonadota bacterium]
GSHAAGGLRPGRGAWRVARSCALVGAFLAGGCDESFEPIAPSDLRFSVWGYLDPAADTQWIRVMPIRPQALTSPGPSDVTVTLEEVGTDRVILLRDSMFTFVADPGTKTYAHNFWTDAPIEPGAVYRFRAEREDGPAAGADVAVPAVFEAELWVAQVQTENNRLRLPGIRYVAFAEEAFELDAPGCSGRTVELHALKADSAADGESVTLPIASFRLPESCGPTTVAGRATIIASGTPWPSELEYAPGVLGDADVLGTNIDNALGFLAGVLSRTFQYQACELADPSAPGVPAHCVLRYGGTSASVSGAISAPACGVAGVSDALITLEEVDGEPAGARRTRRVRSAFRGAYRVLALEPGFRHRLTVEWESGEGGAPYAVHTDTLELSPGEALAYDVALAPTGACGGTP